MTEARSTSTTHEPASPSSGSSIRAAARIDLVVLHEEGYCVPAKPDEDGRYRSRLVPDLWFGRSWLTDDASPNVAELVLQMTDDSLGL